MREASFYLYHSSGVQQGWNALTARSPNAANVDEKYPSFWEADTRERKFSSPDAITLWRCVVSAQDYIYIYIYSYRDFSRATIKVYRRKRIPLRCASSIPRYKVKGQQSTRRYLLSLKLLFPACSKTIFGIVTSSHCLIDTSERLLKRSLKCRYYYYC